ncbi:MULTISPECIES: S66 peptidase family protein [unclassified Fusibacter]|uniref:S66 family peptidase n=1 Tax=unclassified Fusibacter TaxID=2624464 RepID=UPI001011ED29|nr:MULTISPECIES: S66 peptidase family protein [unclassified Fusibacter]MCK8059670.1 LD-carboxypeptidase [Fusibacter sp. A2]NPE21471.1 LD-carboxypeptidase [Fusibacter sp. A1]RXV61882.1 LD-carboxypeptidase [Fusibacter sp. A1]
MHIIRPEKLKAGDKVAVVSLSWGGAGDPVIHERYLLAKKRLEEDFGLEVVAMPHALRGTEFVEAHPELRAKDLMDAFKDTSIKAVISAIGGNDTIRLLPFIDYDVIRENPKFFMGYSDTTVNHFMMLKAGVQSFYGPCILMEFAENVKMHDYTDTYLRKVMFSEEPVGEIMPAKLWTAEYLPWDKTENNQTLRTMIEDTKGYEVIQGSGRVEGHLLGGCVEVLDWLRGTELWPDKEVFRGAILFLETSEDQPSPDALLFMLRAIRATGVLDELAGVFVAKPYDECHYEAYKDVFKRVFTTEMDRPDLPVLYNGNFGHTSPMHAMPYMQKARMDLDNRRFHIL